MPLEDLLTFSSFLYSFLFLYFFEIVLTLQTTKELQEIEKRQFEQLSKLTAKLKKMHERMADVDEHINDGLTKTKGRFHPSFLLAFILFITFFMPL
jgi:hypothetical protein